jgi:hypothetical protein
MEPRCAPLLSLACKVLFVFDLRQFSRVLAGSLILLSLAPRSAFSQLLMTPAEAGESVTPLPSDLAILESTDQRQDLPCTVTPRKAELGFDLRFHTGFDVTVPLKELAGDSAFLTVVFRAYPQSDPNHPEYFLERFRTPAIADDAKGDALLQGSVDVGEGSYHIDWLMRDRQERICSSNWTMDAAMPAKDKPMPLFIGPNQISESQPEPFVNDVSRPQHATEGNLNLKLLVNFAPQDAQSAAMQRSDTDALVSILKTIERDPHVRHISLVAFNMGESRILYRQDTADQIDFPALGHALNNVKLGTVAVDKLGEKHSGTTFLEGLIEREVSSSAHADAVVFAGPKAMLDADVPQDDLRRIGNVEYPVFYMNYNLNPQAVPWKDSISHAIRAFKGTEYTISRPRDLWVSTTEMVSRIVRSKREKAVATALGGSGGGGQSLQNAPSQ